MNVTDTEAALHNIDQNAKVYSSARNLLAMRVRALQSEIQALTARRLPGIKGAAVIEADAKRTLSESIRIVPHLFVQPRTITLHGIKLGLKKGAGCIDWENDEKLAAKIQKLLPEQFDVLVKVTRKPLAKALQALEIEDLKKLGCTIEGTGDMVVIKDAAGAVDKFLATLLNEEEQTTEAAS